MNISRKKWPGDILKEKKTSLLTTAVTGLGVSVMPLGAFQWHTLDCNVIGIFQDENLGQATPTGHTVKG